MVRTDKWLLYYMKFWNEKKTERERFLWQQKLFIKPISDYFREHKVNELHHYFLALGLVHPNVNVKSLDNQPFRENLWKVAQQKFLHLRKKWEGPDIPIFILPIEREREDLIRDVGGKTGVSTESMICLFIDPFIKKEQLFSLIVHEYHHICRLERTKNLEETITLLESIIMEGLAEVAVKEEVGQKALAPWVNNYNLEECLVLFDYYYRDHLLLKGRKNYRHLLNGDRKAGIPRMLGYSIGYMIVDNVIEKNHYSTKELLSMSALTIYKKSSFSK
ncbi:DUF2268 domain-containing protein [Alkalihalobacillus pseudalcaliphilus]|uniref:DUF2268 domain-containing protein n=1 Tax=Alkalihalobacillus pseudalcaliphilus TaxID=79884 RepID=UPI0023605269|nr:DUF2268 domain-containing putative Zn-dependent protease [Alkalihalobacillus pseudalcaliphilus]